jgi:hypothetical protein
LIAAKAADFLGQLACEMFAHDVPVNLAVRCLITSHHGLGQHSNVVVLISDGKTALQATCNVYANNMVHPFGIPSLRTLQCPSCGVLKNYAKGNTTILDPNSSAAKPKQIGVWLECSSCKVKEAFVRPVGLVPVANAPEWLAQDLLISGAVQQVTDLVSAPLHAQGKGKDKAT